MQAPSLIIILVLFAFAKALVRMVSGQDTDGFKSYLGDVFVRDGQEYYDVWCRRHAHSHKSRYDDKIVGGSTDTIEKNPEIVYLILEDIDQEDYQCGGSIISEYYILTAAHCMKDIVNATIRAGSSNANSGGQLYKSASIIQHPSYNPRTYDNDVALIRTTKPIKLDGITTKKIKLPKQECDIASGTNIKVAGWGATKENGSISPDLLSVVVQAVSNDACEKQLGYSITSCQFCAGVPEGGKDTCQGDSGGPAVVSDSARSKYSRKTCSGQTGKQVGIVSNGVGCARPGKPGVYTRVSCTSVRSWIKLNTGV